MEGDALTGLLRKEKTHKLINIIKKRGFWFAEALITHLVFNPLRLLSAQTGPKKKKRHVVIAKVSQGAVRESLAPPPPPPSLPLKFI